MISNRILIVRIQGVGYLANLSDPLTLTSRAGLSYLPGSALEGVVSGLSAQMSSEIALLDSLGSDPTTSFQVLSTDATLLALLSRGARVLRDAANAAVLTTAYLSPEPSPIVYVTSTATLASGDIVRIGSCAIQVAAVLDSTSFSGTYVYGSVAVPVPLRDNGSGYEGVTVYSLVKNGVPLTMGGVEQLPVVISTADENATSKAGEEVIFRGFISRLSVDTSAHGKNQISVECGSMMGFVRNAPFRPVPYQMFLAFVQRDGSYVDPTAEMLGNAGNRFVAVHRPELLGVPYEIGEVQWATRVGPPFQIRKDTYGGILRVESISAPEDSGYFLLQLSSTQIGEYGNISISGFNLMFKDGFYGLDNPARLNVSLTAGSLAGTGYDRSGPWESWSTVVNPEFAGEICFSSTSVPNLIVDLLIGTYAGDFTGYSGVRAAGQSAFLPFAWADVASIVDYPSLLSALGDERVASDVPAVRFNGLNFILPYEHSSARTVGDVLELILKSFGVWMVYDRGRFTFGSWAASGSWSREVDDTGLATPQISLQFDRLNCVRSAEVVRVLSLHDGEIVRVSRPINNTAMATAAGGKLAALRSFVVSSLDDTQINAWRSSVAIVSRYGQASAMVEVTYRDAVYDLNVGESVALSSAYLPNGVGAMGVFAATGFVLKAARSWLTPSTTYSIVLPGYLYAASRSSYVSVTGTVSYVDIGEMMIVIEPNDYTLPAGEALQGAPTSDAAAFSQALERAPSGSLKCQLVNQYGSGYAVFADLVSVAGDVLTFDAPLTGAVPGDKIILDYASRFTAPDLAASWDAFQADVVGQVGGSTQYAFPWGSG